MNLKTGSILILCFSHIAALLASAGTQPSLRLEVSANHRFLVTSNGQPFYYLGDTAWALFSCLNREDAAQYLEKRSAQGFTVIQAALTFRQTNIYGRPPFLENDPARPAMTTGADPFSPEQYDFWDHADYIIDQAARHGLYVGFLPVWGIARPGRSPAFNEISAEAYGKFLGARYKDKPIIWILGDDQSPEGNDTPTGKAFTVRMGRISGASVKAQWYDPRDGTCTSIGVFPNSGNQRFTPPTSRADLDWVLVLDDASKDFPDPGTPNLNK